MPIEILGISSSPIPNSNTDRAVQAVLAASGLESDFVKLSKLKIEPCRACLGCKESNHCVVRDDGRELAERFRTVKAFVLGVWTPYSSLDARAKAFMERMYCLRHQVGLNRGKHGAMVITSAIPSGCATLPPAADVATQQIGFWMMEEGMVNHGSVVLLGNVPCIRCGFGDQCELSGIAMIHGPTATVESAGINDFDDNPEARAAAKQLGEALGKAVREEVADG